MSLSEYTINNEELNWVGWESLAESRGIKTLLSSGGFPTVPETIHLLEDHLGKLDKVFILMPWINAPWYDLPDDLSTLISDSGIDLSLEMISSLMANSRGFYKYLKGSAIAMDYIGPVECHDWERFLSLIMEGVIRREMTYSPRFFSQDGLRLVFFHHSGDIVMWEKNLEEVV